MHSPNSNAPAILVVDDDQDCLDSTLRILVAEGYAVHRAENARDALRILNDPDAGPTVRTILTDVRMPGVSGLDFLRSLRVSHPGITVILMTAFGSVEDAVWAMKAGAVDFLSKPFKRKALLQAIQSAWERSTSTVTIQGDAGTTRLIGQSPEVSDLRALIARVAPTESTILITGESGSGKELVARMIHESSSRALGPFVALNCGSIPENLIEAELFGHEKGAFSGASSTREGLFQAAHNGTLFLDEIGDMPLLLQGRLLRALQEKEVRKVGARSFQKVNVRVLSATHRDLPEEVRQGRFREDLLFRLDVINLKIAPLRARVGDIAPMCRHFLELFNDRHSKKIEGMEETVSDALSRHPWPGNVRELSNVIERAVILCRSTVLSLEDLPPHISLNGENGGSLDRLSERFTISVGTPIRDVEALMIRKTLDAMGGDKETTARLLGINARTIYRRLKKEETVPDDQK